LLWTDNSFWLIERSAIRANPEHRQHARPVAKHLRSQSLSSCNDLFSRQKIGGSGRSRYDVRYSIAALQQFALVNPQRQDTPTDPQYDRAEPDDEDHGTATNLYDERFDLFGFPSALTRTTALYADGPHAGQPMISGYNAAGAWKLERGRPDVVVAILDTGIKWDREGLRLQVHLNRGELPPPQNGASACVRKSPRVSA